MVSGCRRTGPGGGKMETKQVLNTEKPLFSYSNSTFKKINTTSGLLKVWLVSGILKNIYLEKFAIFFLSAHGVCPHPLLYSGTYDITKFHWFLVFFLPQHCFRKHPANIDKLYFIFIQLHGSFFLWDFLFNPWII